MLRQILWKCMLIRHHLNGLCNLPQWEHLFYCDIHEPSNTCMHNHIVLQLFLKVHKFVLKFLGC
jgi:hypothetical protein